MFTAKFNRESDKGKEYLLGEGTITFTRCSIIVIHPSTDREFWFPNRTDLRDLLTNQYVTPYSRKLSLFDSIQYVNILSICKVPYDVISPIEPSSKQILAMRIHDYQLPLKHNRQSCKLCNNKNHGAPYRK